MGYPEGVQLSSGLGGRLPSDSVAAWHRIGWQESPEYAYVVETPGTIHTLHVTAGTEIVFTVTG
jgi:hypothetical protein